MGRRSAGLEGMSRWEARNLKKMRRAMASILREPGARPDIFLEARKVSRWEVVRAVQEPRPSWEDHEASESSVRWMAHW